MAGRLWHLIRHMLARVRWPLAGLTALMVVLVVPQWLVAWELGAPAHTLTAAEKAKAINDVRTTLLQGIGGAVLLLGAYFTYRQLQTGREQLQIAQQGQVTERFTRAIDQLGHADPDVRLGGIYALERIANDSPEDRATITEVLMAFIRGHAPWPPSLEGQPLADAPIEQVPELQVRAPDVQAALTVLARRQPPPKPNGRLDLHATDLRRARFIDANLQGAILIDANLQGAILFRAQLQEAILDGANLHGANLWRSDLQEARLDHADIQEANLTDANLQEAMLGGARLQKAYLTDANLHLATLIHADLQGARLDRADLHEASLAGANLQEANLTGAQLQDAQDDPTTTWPAGFDPGHAGVVRLIDGLPDTAEGVES